MAENEWGREEGFRRESSEGRDEVLRAEVVVDDKDEAGLRPRRLEEFVGQVELKEHLGVVLDAARGREQPPDHLLFAGPPGLGKTTLAGIVAAELDVAMHITSGPAIERAGDLAAILTNLGDRDVLFIDEIHRLPKQVEEVLYPAMEDFQLDVVLGKGPAARSIRFDLPPFTLVGATTRTGLIAGPLRDRFGLVERLDYYNPEELKLIVERAAGILSVTIDSPGAAELANRRRVTPRIAQNGLALFGVDELGLDKVDRSILESIAVTHRGGPVGLSTLSISVGEQPETLEDVYEPFLIQQGLIQRTPRGRVVTAATFEHLGVAAPEQPPEDPSLFE